MKNFVNGETYGQAQVKKLSKKEYARMIERQKREEVLKAGSMVFDDLTGRSYQNNMPTEKVTINEQYREKRGDMPNY